MPSKTDQDNAKAEQGYIQSPRFRTCANCRHLRTRINKSLVRHTCSLGHFATSYNSTCDKHERKE